MASPTRKSALRLLLVACCCASATLAFSPPPLGSATGRTSTIAARTIPLSPADRPGRLPRSSSALNFFGNDFDDGYYGGPPPPGPPRFPRMSSEKLLRSVAFTAFMALCGAALGPFLSSYHVNLGVTTLDFDAKKIGIFSQLWGTAKHPALIAPHWMPWYYAALASANGWLMITLDKSVRTRKYPANNSGPVVLVGLALLAMEYYGSGLLFNTKLYHWECNDILIAMSCFSGFIYLLIDRTLAGLFVGAVAAVAGPILESNIVLSSRSAVAAAKAGTTAAAAAGAKTATTTTVATGLLSQGLHYNNPEFILPLWMIPVYFAGGIVVGNLGRSVYHTLKFRTWQDYRFRFGFGDDFDTEYDRGYYDDSALTFGYENPRDDGGYRARGSGGGIFENLLNRNGGGGGGRFLEGRDDFVGGGGGPIQPYQGDGGGGEFGPMQRFQNRPYDSDFDGPQYHNDYIPPPSEIIGALPSDDQTRQSSDFNNDDGYYNGGYYDDNDNYRAFDGDAITIK